MANSFINLKSIAREALPALIENLVMPELTYKDYSGTFTDLGNTIQVKKPVILEANDFTDGDNVTVQDMNENSVDITLDKIADVSVEASVLERALEIGDNKLTDDFILPATRAIASKINKDGVEMYRYVPSIAGGTAGTTPSGLDAFAAIRKQLNKSKAPMSERYALWDVNADSEFTKIGNLVKANESNSNRTLREGEIGRVFGLDNYMTQAIETHVNGGAGTILIDGAAKAGATTIHLDGLTSAMANGDMFTINGDTTVYTVAVAGALDGADQDIVIVPALAKNAADNAAVTLAAGCVNNLAFHKNAIAFVTRPLVVPKGGVEAYTVSDRGYSLRVTMGYDMKTKKEMFSMDVLYNYAVVYPELATRYLG